MMSRIAPNWLQVCTEIRSKLVEIIDLIDEGRQEKADPSLLVMDVASELQFFMRALEQDLSV